MLDRGGVARVPIVALSSLVVWTLCHRLARRRSRRRMVAGRTTVAARSVTGRAHPVLSPVWSSVRVTPHRGRLDVRHVLVDDEVTAIDVEEVSPGSRRPTWRDRWRMSVVDPRVLTVHTPEGPVELAVAADQVDWLRSRLAGADLSLTAEVEALLYRHDPIGIAFGDNPDEYSPEAESILVRLPQARSVDDVRALVHEEFVQWFDEEIAGPADRYEAIARELWCWWDARTSSGS